MNINAVRLVSVIIAKFVVTVCVKTHGSHGFLMCAY